MAILKDLTQRTAPASEPVSRAYEITMKVSDKGGVSLYGLQRWPVTLYADQWRSVLAQASDILAFIEENKHRLSSKGE